MNLYDILKEYSKNGRIPYHMPGHKRSSQFEYINKFCDIDFTEIDGLDNLHAPCGIISEAMQKAAEIYGAEQSFFLVNGSTGGIISAVYSTCRHKSIVMARSCHKSVYNAADISECDVSYIMPRISSSGYFLDVTPSEVEKALEQNPNASAVIVTSPTYEGVVCDVRRIADICHSAKIPLIVDSAHGSHLGFLEKEIPSSVVAGADIVIMSLHKTLPSLTQTALLHVSGNLVDRDKLRTSISMFETSSPSYIFMASTDGCIETMRESSLFDKWSERIEKICLAAKKSNIEIEKPHDVFAYDKSKLILKAQGMSGAEIAETLRKRYNIEPEMISQSYVLLMTGAGDTDEMTDALCRALETFPECSTFASKRPSPSIPLPESVISLSAASQAESENVKLRESTGRIAAETITAYPPGIPIIAPGEKISDEIIQNIIAMKENKISVLTSYGELNDCIKVVKSHK